MEKVSSTSRAKLFCFSLVKSELTWRGPGRVQIRSKNNSIKRTYFCLINDRVTRGSMQIKIFSTLSGQLPSSVWFPFNFTMTFRFNCSIIWGVGGGGGGVKSRCSVHKPQVLKRRPESRFGLAVRC